jgi:thiol-disulfide isomerase/thioredoxin
MSRLLRGLLVLAPALCLAAAAGADGAEKSPLGTRPPEWELTDWLNSPPLTLKGLRGKVVLVRWWTVGCPYCKATAPALNELHRRYRDRGLVVVGVYHHKSPAPLREGQVKRGAEALGFRFPVATDPGWKTLRRWWLDGGRRRWTSVSFLLDREGVVRHIHRGGSYAPGSNDYRALKDRIEELLRQS